MKKITLLLLLTSFTFSFAQTASPSPYCASNYSNEPFALPDYFITSVVLKNATLITKNVQSAAPNYQFYNTVVAQDLPKNSQANITINFNGSTMHYIDAWIDYNKNNAFDTGESIGYYDRINDPNMNMNVTSKTFSFTVPASAQNGTTRLRVRVVEDDDVFFSNPALPVTICQQYANGETLDFNVTISNALSTESFDKNTLSVFPNPVSDLLTITNDNAAIDMVSISNALGQTKTVKTAITDKSVIVDCSNLSSGIYFLSVQSEGKVFTQKVVKN